MCVRRAAFGSISALLRRVPILIQRHNKDERTLFQLKTNKENTKNYEAARLTDGFSDLITEVLK